jgi:hypothetical protein
MPFTPFAMLIPSLIVIVIFIGFIFLIVKFVLSYSKMAKAQTEIAQHLEVIAKKMKTD